MNEPTPAPARGPLGKMFATGLHRAVRSQAESAQHYVAKLRAAHPDASPADVRQMLDRRFLTVVTASGTAVGAAGAVPGIGTVAGLGAVGVESVLFLEVAALYTMSVACVHGLDLNDPSHRETLVMTVMLGSSGTALLANAVGGSGTPGGAAGGSLAGGALRLPSVRDLNARLVSRFLRRFATRRATLALGKLAPAGIGAAIGGWGNRKVGKVMIEAAHSTFGTPPAAWP